ncbi:MAG: hypothetical protein K2X74_22560 [Acetobacteraceae bacterium]|nr:hypothetical protein [Acetobacteraceae bacterium]
MSGAAIAPAQPAAADAETAPRSQAGPLALMLLMALAAACGHVQLGDTDQRPYWRRPGPAPLEQQERYRVPDDGFLDHLAARGAGPGVG